MAGLAWHLTGLHAAGSPADLARPSLGVDLGIAARTDSSTVVVDVGSGM